MYWVGLGWLLWWWEKGYLYITFSWASSAPALVESAIKQTGVSGFVALRLVFIQSNSTYAETHNMLFANLRRHFYSYSVCFHPLFYPSSTTLPCPYSNKK